MGVATKSFAGGLLKSNMLRLAVGSLVIVAILIVGGLIALSVTRSSHTQPIAVEQYPGAKLLEEKTTDKSDRRVYSTGASVDRVLRHFADRLNKDDQNGCFKIYTDETTTLRSPTDELPGHHYGRCIVDTSWLDVTQNLIIEVHYVEGSGTIIEVLRNWGS
jgi:hypothetical protein